MNKLKAILCVGIFVILVCVAVTFFIADNNEGHDDDDADYGRGASIMCVDVGDEAYVYVDEKPIERVDSAYRVYRNGDSNVCYIAGIDNELYILCKDTIKEVAVDKHISYVEVSKDSVEALLVDEDDNIYYCDGEEVVKVAKAEPEYIYISDDGESYAYFRNNSTYYVYCGNRARRYGDCVLRGIASDGSYITVLKGGEKHSDPDGPDEWYEGGELITIDTAGNETKLETDNGTNANRNYLAKTKAGEGLYVEQYKTYISTKDNESMEILDESIHEVLHSRYHKNELESMEGLVCYSKYTNICYVMTADYQLKKVAEDCDSLYDADDNSEKILYQSVDNKLCVVENTDLPQKKVLNDYPELAEMSSDGKAIYYILNVGKGNREFHYVDEDYNDKVLLEMKEYSDMFFMTEGCYLSTGGTNYFIKDGKAVKVEQQGWMHMDSISDNMYCSNSDGVYRLDGAMATRLEGEYGDVRTVLIAD